MNARALIAMGALGFASCQCAQLRTDLVYPCASDADCLDEACVAGFCGGRDGGAGGGTGGGSGGGSGGGIGGGSGGGSGGGGTGGGSGGGFGGSGGDAGSDAGTDGGTDAGVDAGTDAGSLFCQTWNCARPSSWCDWDGGATIETLACPYTDAGAEGAWLGAVLTPQGVIGIPWTAPYAIRIDPKTMQCEPIGGLVTGTYSGGVLGEDGFVYATPRTAARVLRIDPDGGPSVFVGPIVGANNYHLGSTLDGQGGMWMVPEDNGALYGTRAMRIQLSDGGISTFDGGATFWEMVKPQRVPIGGEDRIFFLPYINSQYQQLASVDPAAPAVERVEGYSFTDGGIPLHTLRIRGDGTLIATSPTSPQLVHLRADAGAATTVVAAILTTGLAGTGFTATGADGEVWSFTSQAGLVRVQRLAPGGGSEFVGSPGFSTLPWGGIVATEDGFIGVPAYGNKVLRVRLGCTEPRTARQLMSPYFNSQ